MRWARIIVNCLAGLLFGALIIGTLQGTPWGWLVLMVLAILVAPPLAIWNAQAAGAKKLAQNTGGWRKTAYRVGLGLWVIEVLWFVMVMAGWNALSMTRPFGLFVGAFFFYSAVLFLYSLGLLLLQFEPKAKVEDERR